MDKFVEANNYWIIPVFGVILTLILKLANMPSTRKLTFMDWADLGIDITVAAILMLFPISLKQGNHGWFLVVSYVVVLVILGLITARCGWKSNGQKKPLLILISDIIGVVIIILSALYIGGKI